MRILGRCTMRKKPLRPDAQDSRRSTLSQRLEIIRRLNCRKIPIQPIADALIEAGYTSLDKQAKELGIHRATTWTIIKKRHKLGRLNTKTAQRILENPNTPPSVRAIIEQALTKAATTNEPGTEKV